MTALGEDSITLTIPPAVEALLGPPALLAGESAETYNAMLSDFAAAVGPSDFVEWVWVKDVTDLTWEIVRVRRFKTGIIANAQKDGLTSILDSLVQDGFLYSLNTEQPNQMATQWFAGGEARRKRLLRNWSNSGSALNQSQRRPFLFAAGSWQQSNRCSLQQRKGAIRHCARFLVVATVWRASSAKSPMS